MIISSPCVRLCVFDEASGLCQGCGRDLGEIAGWSSLDESERIAIMADLPARLAASREARMRMSRRPAGRRQPASR